MSRIVFMDLCEFQVMRLRMFLFRHPWASLWMSPCSLQGFSLLQWYVTWWKPLHGGTVSSKQKLSVASSLGSYQDSYDCYSPALILFYFISLPSLTFPQNIAERQCYSYRLLSAHVNATAPSSGDSVLESLLKCHGLRAKRSLFIARKQ